eukprot:359937-Chlamydomonas_euryale.AAC.16
MTRTWCCWPGAGLHYAYLGSAVPPLAGLNDVYLGSAVGPSLGMVCGEIGHDCGFAATVCILCVWKSRWAEYRNGVAEGLVEAGQGERLGLIQTSDWPSFCCPLAVRARLRRTMRAAACLHLSKLRQKRARSRLRRECPHLVRDPVSNARDEQLLVQQQGLAAKHAWKRRAQPRRNLST